MALEAINKNSKERVKLWKLSEDEIRQLQHDISQDRDLFTCDQNDCDCSLHIRALDSDNRVTHFARFPNTGKDTYHLSSGESPKHLMAKERLAKMLQLKYPTAEIITEYTISGNMEFKDRRRIDVYLEHPDGRKEAHEIQFAYQTTATTERRTRDYKTHGIDSVIWWWGDKCASNEAYAEWCINSCDFYGTALTVTERVMGVDLPTGTKLELFDCNKILEERRLKRERERHALEEKYQEYAVLLSEGESIGLAKYYLEPIESYDTARGIELKTDRLRRAIHQERLKASRSAVQVDNSSPDSLIGCKLRTFLNGEEVGAAVVERVEPDGRCQTTSGLWWILENGRLYCDERIEKFYASGDMDA